MNSDQKTLWAALVTLLCILALAAGVYLYTKHQSAGTIVAPATIPITPPAAGTITSVTPTTITVATQGGGTRTVAITPSTTVHSVVASGVMSSGLADLSVGTVVLIIPVAGDPNTAASINLPPPTPAATPASATSIAFSGKVSAISPTDITLTLAGGITKKILTNSKTIVLSNVSAGEMGKALSDLTGLQVQVLGVSSNSSVTAETILVAQ